MVAKLCDHEERSDLILIKVNSIIKVNTGRYVNFHSGQIV